MSKFIRSAIIYTALLCSLSGMVYLLTFNTTFAFSPITVVGSEKGLKVDADNAELFNIGNIYPGKEISSNLRLQNKGNDKMALLLATEKVNGDNILWEQLRINISDSASGYTYYQGSLNELKKIKLNSLSAGEEEELTFIISLGNDAGHECQGSALETEWTITASWDNEEIIEPPPGDNPATEPGNLPQTTGIRLFLYLSLGFMLIITGWITIKKYSSR